MLLSHKVERKEYYFYFSWLSAGHWTLMHIFPQLHSIQNRIYSRTPTTSNNLKLYNFLDVRIRAPNMQWCISWGRDNAFDLSVFGRIVGRRCLKIQPFGDIIKSSNLKHCYSGCIANRFSWCAHQPAFNLWLILMFSIYNALLWLPLGEQVPNVFWSKWRHNFTNWRNTKHNCMKCIMILLYVGRW